MLTINLTWIKGACYNMTQKRRIDASTKATNEKLYPIQYLDAPTVLSFLQNHVSFLSDYMYKGKFMSLMLKEKKGRKYHIYIYY